MPSLASILHILRSSTFSDIHVLYLCESVFDVEGFSLYGRSSSSFFYSSFLDFVSFLPFFLSFTIPSFPHHSRPFILSLSSTSLRLHKSHQALIRE